MKLINTLLAFVAVTYVFIGLIGYCFSSDVRKYGTRTTAKAIHKLEDRVERLETVFQYRN